MYKIILASGSPRRKELLSLAGYSFEIITSNIEEIVTKTTPEEVVEELSLMKATDVYTSYSKDNEKNILVIGADTVVSIDGKILGKPKDENSAYEMLKELQDRTHEVYTGVTLVWGNEIMHAESFHECTKVTFYPMSDEEIWEYIKTGDPMDKAGAYGIQGGASKFVKRIYGDYNNVVGLPIARLYHNIKILENEML